ncbi:MAG: transglutaminase family protein [Planctomycetales bacterium]|nr:transglutaminase family protein [Planctomycetales bacterium]
MQEDPVFCRAAAFRHFIERTSSVSCRFDLFRAAWTIAEHEHPDASLEEGEAIIVSLARTVNRRVRSQNPEARLAHLHDVLFEIYGLAGNVEDYYNPLNSYLPYVLQSRRGIPISLTLIYCCVAELAGIETFGINAPGHFLAEVPMGQERGSASMYIDPFYGGVVLHEDEISGRIAAATGKPVRAETLRLTRAAPRDWLARILNNLQASFAAADRQRDVLAMQELQSTLTARR